MTYDDIRAAIELLAEAFPDAARLCDPDVGVEVADPTKPAGLDESSFPSVA
jgi:hypothetical protein